MTPDALPRVVSASGIAADKVVLADPLVPSISVVMPVHGRGDLAVEALRSLADTAGDLCEVIVVDDASPDTAVDEIEARVTGFRLIRLAKNVGFPAAVDVGLTYCRGRYVLILNSDVVLHHGWLEPLLDVLESDASVAAVSPVLMNPDGSIQEAGSVLFDDATATTVDELATWDEFRRRQVAFASAACLLIRRSALCAVGGLDPAYGTGYYEDVELAGELSKSGSRIVVEPTSRATHIRSASSNGGEHVALMQNNRSLFASRRPCDLQDAAARPGMDSPASRARVRDRTVTDRVLVIDDRVPLASFGSGDPRMALLLERFSKMHPRALVTVVSKEVDPYAAERLARFGIEVADWSQTGSPEAWIAHRRGHWSATVVSRMHNFEQFASVITETQPQAVKVVDVEAVFTRRAEGWLGLLSAQADPRADAARDQVVRMERSEHESWRWADLILCVSDEEAAVVRHVVPDSDVTVVSWGTPAVADPHPRNGREGIAFFGGFHSGEEAPNADAVRYLVDHLLPHLIALAPDTTLDVVGSNPTPSVISRAGGRVSVLGEVDDPVSALGNYVLHVAPLRFGSGVKLKLIDTMAAGTPFVTTSNGSEGLGLGSLKTHLVADDPHEIVTKAVRLMTDDYLWHEVQASLLEIVRRDFSTDAFDASLADLSMKLGMVAGW